MNNEQQYKSDKQTDTHTDRHDKATFQKWQQIVFQIVNRGMFVRCKRTKLLHPISLPLSFDIVLVIERNNPKIERMPSIRPLSPCPQKDYFLDDLIAC